MPLARPTLLLAFSILFEYGSKSGFWRTAPQIVFDNLGLAFVSRGMVALKYSIATWLKWSHGYKNKTMQPCSYLTIFDIMKNILLVDDENEVAQVFQTGLSSAGFQVVVVSNGQSALDAVKSNKFDAILIDQMMPDMSGIDVLKTLKANEETKNIPMAMLTNFGHDEMVKEALNLGANDYILKYQVAPNDLVAKVKTLVGE